MTWQQIAIIVLLAIGGTVNLLKHGETTKINFWSWTISAALLGTILYTAGFFG